MYWSGFVANLQRPNYRYPILRNIGRSYRSTDVANIPIRGEASSDLAISGGRGTQVLWSGQIVADLSNGSYGHAKSNYRYSRDQRSDTPCRTCAQVWLPRGMFFCGLSVSGDRPGSGEGLNEFILALTPSLVAECMKIVFSSRFDGSRFYRITVYTCCWPVGLICVEGSS